MPYIISFLCFFEAMNVHTFKDVGKRDSLAHDVEDADEDQIPAVRMKGTVEGEEESDTKFNDIGEVMEPFNLKEERETGFYDESGNYVFRDEKHQEVDAWVADLDEATMVRIFGFCTMILNLHSGGSIVYIIYLRVYCFTGESDRRIRSRSTEEATERR